MNEDEAPLNKATKVLLIIIAWGCMALACFVWYCNYITEKAYKRGLNEVPESMQRVTKLTKESDSLTIQYFLEHSTPKRKALQEGFWFI